METYQNLSETNLPIDLLLWVTRDRIIKPLALKTFLYLKLYHRDRFVLKPQLYMQISDGLGISVKTARSHIQELIEAKFIGHDVATEMLFVRSKYKVIPDRHRKTNYQVGVSREHLDHFTEFILAAAIAYLARKQSRIAKYRSALPNDGVFQNRYEAIRKCYRGWPISVSYLVSFLGKKKSWVDKYKKKARKLGWITFKHYWDQTGIQWKFRFPYMSENKIPFGRAKKYRGKLHLIGTDILSSNIHVHKRKKSG